MGQRIPASKFERRSENHRFRSKKNNPKQYSKPEKLEEFFKSISPRGKIIVAPADIAVTHQLRAEAFATTSYVGEKKQTDLFVWSRGEPTKHVCTKIGGVPYWPSKEPWPTNSDGEPIRFIAQFCFADSPDLTGVLPGDVLVIFGDDEALLTPDQLIFKWLPLGINEVLEIAPVTREPFSPLYGVKYRTEDWPDAISILEKSYRNAEQIAYLEGTKIGGLPKWIQGEEPVSGRFLASLGSFAVDGTGRWPFVNFEVSRGYDHIDSDLMIGDMGSLYFYIDSDGKVEAVNQCY